MFLVILILNTLLNFAFNITFRYQVDDYQFNIYKRDFGWVSRLVTILTLVLSLHMFRILFCKLFNIQAMFAAATQPDEFYKPIKLFSLLHWLGICLPVTLVNVYGVVVSFEGEFWDN